MSTNSQIGQVIQISIWSLQGKDDFLVIDESTRKVSPKYQEWNYRH